MKTPQPCSRRQFLGGTLAAGTSAAVLYPLPLPAAEVRAAEPKPRELPRKIKLGIIGCGGRGPWLGGLFKKHGGYELHALADYFADNANKAGDELGVEKAHRFSGLHAHKRLLASGVEAVVVVNVPHFHPEHTYSAIESGCHVYAAKPVAIDVPGA